MNIRCACGNEVTLITDGEGNWIDRSWYSEERNTVECPRCKEKTLPLPIELDEENLPEEGPVRVLLDIYRSVNLTRKRW